MSVNGEFVYNNVLIWRVFMYVCVFWDINLMWIELFVYVIFVLLIENILI